MRNTKKKPTTLGERKDSKDPTGRKNEEGELMREAARPNTHDHNTVMCPIPCHLFAKLGNAK